MLSAFMLTSGWLFWIFVFVVIIAETTATEADNLGACIGIAVAAFVIMALFSDLDPVWWIRQNLVLAILMVPAYFLIGTAWAFWKWHWLIQDSVYEFNEQKASLVKEHATSAWSETPFEEYIRRFKGFPPSASSNKQRITTWIGFWPFSVLWSVLTYPRRAAIWIYKRLVTVFQRMSDSAFEGKFVTPTGPGGAPPTEG